jgi:hypothetical protein
MEDSLEDRMARAESGLERLLAEHTDDDFAIVLQFGIDIGTIGRALVKHPEIAPQVAAFVARTQDLVARSAKLSLWFYRAQRAADNRSSETDEYTNALAMRSDIEFFRQLYKGSKAESRISDFDGETEVIDKDLEEWGRVQYLESIPDDIPPSHVWWHQSLSGL